MNTLKQQQSRRLSLSLSAWFCAPEQGMKDLQILARSSAAVVVTRQPHSKDLYHVITSSHVVAPWRWPKYYPQPWLQALNERHTHYSVELRHPDGMFLTSVDLAPESFHHAARDLAVLRFEPEELHEALNTLAEFQYRPLELLANCCPPGATGGPFAATAAAGAQLNIGDRIKVSGHEVLGTVLEDGTDLRKPVPMTTSGEVRRRSGAWPFTQCFLTTDQVLTLGMCGGPAVKMVVGLVGAGTKLDSGLLVSSDSTASALSTGVRPASRKAKTTATDTTATTSSFSTPSSTPTPTFIAIPPSQEQEQEQELVCGVVEGIVPLDHPNSDLAGLAVIVESQQIADFITDIERGVVPEADWLRGGEAAAWVGEQMSGEVGVDGEEELDVVKLIERSEALAEADEARARKRTGPSGGMSGGGGDNLHGSGLGRSNFPQ